MMTVHRRLSKMNKSIQDFRLKSAFHDFTAHPDTTRCHHIIGVAGEWLALRSINENALAQTKSLRAKYGDKQQDLSLYLPMIDVDSRTSLTVHAFLGFFWPLCPANFHATSGNGLRLFNDAFNEFFQVIESQSGNNQVKVIQGLIVLWQTLAHLTECGGDTRLLHEIYQDMLAVIQSAQAAVDHLQVSTSSDEHNRLRGQCLKTCLHLQCAAINWVIDGARFYGCRSGADRSQALHVRHKESMLADLKQFNDRLSSLNQLLPRMNRPIINCSLVKRLVRHGYELPLKNDSVLLQHYRDCMQKITWFDQVLSERLSFAKQRAMRPVIHAMIYHVTANTKDSALLYDDQRGHYAVLASLSQPSAALLALSWDELIQEGVRRLETHRWPRYELVKQLLVQLGRFVASLFGCCDRSVLLSGDSLFHLHQKPSSVSCLPAINALRAG